MKLLSAAALALLAKAVSAAPTHDIQDVNDYTFQLVNPIPEGLSIKVPNQLYIVMCQDIDFGSPCNGGYVAPGLCYATPPFGVSAVQPAQDVSGCTLYKSTQCDADGGDEGKISDVAYPGIANLVPSRFNDAVNSFLCY